MEKINIKTRRYFAGANTKYGFYNLFSEINRNDRPGFLYILKGGPGTGKSTLMKKVGNAFEGRTGVEYFHCSSDHESLDGVRIPAVNVAIVDGTAPHITETVLPGAREKIIDLGAFISDSVGQNQREIADLIDLKKFFFAQSYLYIKNASNLYKCNNLIFSRGYNDVSAITAKAVRKITREFDLCEAGPDTKKNKGKRSKGTARKLFLSAITGGNFVDYTLHNNFNSIIELKSDSFINDMILKALAEAAVNRGSDITCFCDPLLPENLNAIFVPGADILFKSLPDANILINDKRLVKAVQYNSGAINDAIGAAGRSLNDAKKTHKQIEEFYFPCMDFSSIDEITQMLIKAVEKRMDFRPG